MFNKPIWLSKKFLLALSMISVLVMTTKIFLLPKYYKFQVIHNQNFILEEQYQQQEKILSQDKLLKQKTVTLQKNNSSQLLSLRHLPKSVEIYQQISLLAQLHQLVLQEIKPTKTEKTNNSLIKQTLQITLNGSESKVFEFLGLLSHQNWFSDFENLLIEHEENQLFLQLELAVYYES